MSTSAMDAAIRLELARGEAMLRLRKAFEVFVIERTERPPPNETLNAWLFVQLARSHSAGLPDGTEHLFVPLADGEPTWPLVKYLNRSRARAKLPADDDADLAIAREGDAFLREQWNAARSRLTEAPPITTTRVCARINDDGSQRVWLDPPPGGQRADHLINAGCASRLRSAFIGEENEYEPRLFLLLQRYSILFGPHSSEGRGWQLATPPIAMEHLTSDFGVDAECFASPMNRRQKRYCSAFLDTDGPFGSSGNFFSSSCGSALESFESAECGPPYDDEVMDLAVLRIEEELRRRDECELPEEVGGAGDAVLSVQQLAGSFVLVVPDWREPLISKFCQRMISSPYLKHLTTLDKEKHRYLDGFQHTQGVGKSASRTRYVQGETGTLLAWLQNDAGARMFPVTEEKVQRQVSAWDQPEREPAQAASKRTR